MARELIFGVLLIGCGASVPAATAAKLEDADRATAAAYRHASDGGAEGILAKAAHCAIQGAIKDLSLRAYDSGVECP